ncbi:unnamed protein product [Phytophthora lilii]|uniref:Unnamed protein product n=1 Tax=Phytophthora lilii TaxID=2077276 RepID=A0A9W6U3Z8_9STRA|nr:unnamed protein product [Phytophthora lilii]
MSLLFEPSAPDIFFEPEDPFFCPEILSLLDLGDLEELLPLGELQHEAAPDVNAKPAARNLKKLRPRPRTGENEEPKSKRSRRPAAAHPRLRNKGKIEMLRREIKTLEAEVEALRHTEHDTATTSEERRLQPLWKIIAMKQSQERERAEHENAKLKNLLNAQCTLAASLSSVIDEWRNLPSPSISLHI